MNVLEHAFFKQEFLGYDREERTVKEGVRERNKLTMGDTEKAKLLPFDAPLVEGALEGLGSATDGRRGLSSG